MDSRRAKESPDPGRAQNGELRTFRERLAELECRLAAVETNSRPPTLSRQLPKLSTTERRVAELVVAGFTDDEVARRLFLTLKTVEWSLTKTYRKLRVRSRAELTALLRPESEDERGGR
jgi:DNA-binding NarL/FixJ family response regulator